VSGRRWQQGEDVSRTVLLLLHPTTHGSAMVLSLHPHQIHCLPLLPVRHYRHRSLHCSHRPAATACACCSLFGGHRHGQHPAWVPACDYPASSAHRTAALVMCAAQLLSSHSALSLQFSLSSRCICSYPYCMIFFSLPPISILSNPILQYSLCRISSISLSWNLYIINIYIFLCQIIRDSLFFKKTTNLLSHNERL
jgi:hypothetical protein